MLLIKVPTYRPTDTVERALAMITHSSTTLTISAWLVLRCDFDDIVDSESKFFLQNFCWS
jgi:hypothetical protein